MSDPAAPWWAEVQHLRPHENGAAAAPDSSAPGTPSGRFRKGVAQRDVTVATLDHDVVDGWTDEADRSWADRPLETTSWPEPAADAAWDAGVGTPTDASPATGRAAEPAEPVWHDSLEEAFARTPSWSEDDAWLLPKGADRIENGRRTIEIRGQVDRVHGFTTPTDSSVATRGGRRPGRRAAARFERRPDRVAMWAFFLGVLLIVVALFSKPGNADAATLAAAGQPPAAAAQVLVVAPRATP